MKDQYIFSGKFEGYYYNHQKVAMNEGDEVKDGSKLKVHMYRGELTEATELDLYEPEKHMNRNSLLLHNVTKVQVIPGSVSDFSEPRVFDFDQVVIKNAVVTAESVIDGKSYGIVQGDFIGKTKKPVQQEPDPTIDPPVIADPPITSPTPIGPETDGPGIDDGPTGGGGGNDGGGGNWGGPGTDDGGSGGTTPVRTDNNDGCMDRLKNGCSSMGGCMPSLGCGGLLSGCLSNIWRILMWLFLLLFLLALLRNCRSCEVSGLIPDWETEEEIRDRNQETVNELSKTMYFKGNRAELNRGSEQPVRDLATFLKENPDVKIMIHGHVNGNPNTHSDRVRAENMELSRQRAEKIKELLIEEGIAENRLYTQWHGAEQMLHPKDSDERLQAKNRRVEIEIL